MEHFGADPRPIVQLCREEVAGSDLVILIQAWRRGMVPTIDMGGDGTTSITGWEIRAADGENAEGRRVDVLAFFADASWPGGSWENDSDARAAVKAFRDSINRSVEFFKSESNPLLPDFRSLVREQLSRYLSNRVAAPAAAPPVTPHRPPSETASLPSEPYPLLGAYLSGRWAAVEQKYRRQLPKIAVAVGVAAGLMIGWAIFASYWYRESNQLETGLTRRRIQTDLVQVLSSQSADLGNLVRLAHEYPSDWSALRNNLVDKAAAKVNPEVFVRGRDLRKFSPEEILSVIDYGYRLLIGDRQVFGAMTFALEEVEMRGAPGDGVKARELSNRLRTAFIDDQKARTKDFEAPPDRLGADGLNSWLRIPGTADVGSFSIQQHEVTNDEYRRFDPTHKFEGFTGRHPVTNVSWYDSAAYAAWLGASLPSEAEWRHAAFGADARRFPWGKDAPTPTRAVYDNDDGPQPVGNRDRGRTPEGVEDLLGNVAEWCRDEFWVDTPEPSAHRIESGGSYRTRADNLRDARGEASAGMERVDVGFRLVSRRSP